MNTITANVRIIDVTFDESGPLLAILFEVLNEAGERPILTGYICGPDAETLRHEFVPGFDASIELEPRLGMDFGRLIRFGIRRHHPMWDFGKVRHSSLPFANSEEHKTIKYLHTRKTATTFFACFPPYGYEDPANELGGF